MSEGDNSFPARIANAALTCRKRNVPYFSRFLTEEEQAALKSVRLPAGVFAKFYGGEKNIGFQRAVLGVFPPRFSDLDDGQLYGIFPIKALTFAFRGSGAVTHRSVLGTLMSLGIERDRIGDIFAGEGTATVYLYDTVWEYVAQTVVKIGDAGVTVSRGVTAELPERVFKDIKLSVLSFRLDNILSRMIGVSRSSALKNYIGLRRVSVNSVVCSEGSKQLSVGDKISVRGVGKFVFYSIDKEGRKGNFHITVKKYI